MVFPGGDFAEPAREGRGMTVPLDMMNDMRSMDAGGVSRAGVIRRGGDNRDTSRRSLEQGEDRGCLRGPLGIDRLEPQREVVRLGRGAAAQGRRLDRAYPHVYVDGVYPNPEIRRLINVVGTSPNGCRRPWSSPRGSSTSRGADGNRGATWT